MRIGDLAKRAGISVSTVRFYEAQGLMPKPATRESGYREYETSDLNRLRLIIAAKRKRFPLGLIRMVLKALDSEPDPCAQIAQMIDERIMSIGREIHDLQRLQAHLRQQLEAWKGGMLPKDECLCAILETNALIKDRSKEMAKIEVFSAGCKCCDDAIRVVKETMCPNCELTVYNMADESTASIAQRYGVTRVPTIVVDGKVCGCCSTTSVNSDDLRAAGVGRG